MKRIFVNDKPYRVPEEIAVYMAESADLIAQLRRDLADFCADRDDDVIEFRRIMDEKCPDDEWHCTCVPRLRKEIQRLFAVQSCGHPLGCVTHEPNSTTQFCQWCADKAEIRRLHSLLRQWKDESESEDNRDLDRGESDDK